jgi:hypothetical protein
VFSLSYLFPVYLFSPQNETSSSIFETGMVVFEIPAADLYINVLA